MIPCIHDNISFILTDNPVDLDKDSVLYQRECIINLTPLDAVNYIHPEYFIPQKLFGPVKVIENLIRKPNGNVFLTRDIKKLPESIII